jgi:hypothetical protein
MCQNLNIWDNYHKEDRNVTERTDYGSQNQLKT